MGLIFELGKLLIELSIKNRLNDRHRESFSSIFNALVNIGAEEYEARIIERSFEGIADKISKSCDDMLKISSFDKERQDAIIKQVLCAYKCANIGESIVFNDNLSNSDVESRLLDANRKYVDDLNSNEQEYYKRIINHSACLIVSTYKNLPEFIPNGISRLVNQVENIDSKIEELIIAFNKVNIYDKNRLTDIDIFNREYKQVIINKYSYINLFGASSIEAKLKKYRLSISYVELELCVEGQEKDEYINPEKMILDTKHNNIWIIGDAGSGKTTLLQWLATTVASSSDKINGTKSLIPIVIELRKFVNEKMTLKKILENTMENSSYSIPEGWIEKNIEMGRFLFLVDGFDEVESIKRLELFNLLDEIDVKNKCKRIFTSRPTVKERPNDIKLVEYRVLPMRRLKIKQFIKYWHRAVLEEQLEVDIAKSSSISDELFERILDSDSLIKLTSYPLLCAMICALHYKSGGNLPTNKREIYEECCKMLLENRDKEREIFINKSLTYEKKKTILSVLSFWMMRNNYVVANRESAESVVIPILTGMGIDSKLNVLDYLIERCGILREPETNKIDFIHRTFQEYLTANEILRSNEWGYLISMIGNESWQETITIAIGYANENRSNTIISKTLELGKENNEEKRYLFIATKFLSGAITVDKSIRNSIERELKRIVPPAYDECSDLSFSGDLLTPHLRNKNEYNSIERICCLKTLRQIGTEKTLQVIKTFLNENTTIEEIKEIGIIISQFDEKMLIENEIPECILYYVSRATEGVIIHEEFLKNLLLLNDLKPNLLSCKTIWIANYEESIYADEYEEFNDDFFRYSNDSFDDYKGLFNNVENLIIEGYFDGLKILKNFKNLKKLFIISENVDYSIYELEKYKVFNSISEFTILLNSNVFINGKDLNFLKNCRVINFYLLGAATEFSLEYFSDYKNLELLNVYSPYVYDFDLISYQNFEINEKEIDFSSEEIDLLKKDYYKSFCEQS